MTPLQLRVLFIGEENDLQKEVIRILARANVMVDFAENGLHALSLNHSQPYDLVFINPESKTIAPLSLANLSILLRYSPAQNLRIISLGPLAVDQIRYFDHVLPQPTSPELKMWLSWPKNLSG